MDIYPIARCFKLDEPWIFHFSSPIVYVGIFAIAYRTFETKAQLYLVNSCSISVILRLKISELMGDWQ
jgi:hypothetical protein